MNDPIYFDTPYRGTPPEELYTITARISSTEARIIRAIRPEQRTVTSTIGHIWKKLVHELITRNISDVSACNEFEHFVTRCRIISDKEYAEYQLLRSNAANEATFGGTAGGLRDRSLSGTKPVTVSSDDSGGTTGVCGPHSADETISTNIQSGSGSKRKRDGKSKASEEGKGNAG